MSAAVSSTVSDTPSGAAGNIFRRTGRRILAAIRAVLAFAHRAYVRDCEDRSARAALSVLRRLDARTLRDLGFDRGSLHPVAIEHARFGWRAGAAVHVPGSRHRTALKVFNNTTTREHAT